MKTLAVKKIVAESKIFSRFGNGRPAAKTTAGTGLDDRF
jgi:hypothetical protein